MVSLTHHRLLDFKISNASARGYLSYVVVCFLLKFSINSFPKSIFLQQVALFI